MKIFNWVIFSLLAFLLLLLFQGSLSHVIYWHEQHVLFRFSETYFTHFLGNPAGLLNYITAFYVQFYYYPLVGSILLGTLLSFVFIINNGIVQKVTNSTDKLMLSLLPALFLTVQYCSIEYPMNSVIGIVLSQLFFLVFLHLNSFLKKYIPYLFLVILFYISGVYSIFFVLYFIIYCLSRKQYYKPAIIIPLFIALFFVASYYYRVSINYLINTITHDTFSVHIILLVAFIPSFLSARYLSRYMPSKKIIVVLLGTLCIAVYGSIALWGLFKNHSSRTRLMLQVDKDVKAGNWDKVLEQTVKYQGKNQLVCYLNNLALYHKGTFNEDFFYYPQGFGAHSLYFAWEGSNTKWVEYGDLIFAELGYYNEATRWAFEAMTIYGETASTLKKLIVYNTCNGKPLVAQRFINVLKESLFYSKQADELEAELQKTPECNAVQHDSTKQNIFANYLNISNDLLYLCNKEPNNKMAFEYLMMNYLLENKVVDFASNIWRIKAFGYTKLPTIYEEALLIFQLMYPEEFKTLDVNISDKTQQQFMRYSKLYASKNYDELRNNFRGTYWYYIHFNSPAGNKIVQ